MGNGVLWYMDFPGYRAFRQPVSSCACAFLFFLLHSSMIWDDILRHGVSFPVPFQLGSIGLTLLLLERVNNISRSSNAIHVMQFPIRGAMVNF